MLLEENKSFFSLSASSPEAFRDSFRFSYSLQRGYGRDVRTDTLLVSLSHSTDHTGPAPPLSPHPFPLTPEPNRVCAWGVSYSQCKDCWGVSAPCTSCRHWRLERMCRKSRPDWTAPMYLQSSVPVRQVAPSHSLMPMRVENLSSLMQADRLSDSADGKQAHAPHITRGFPLRELCQPP